MPASRTPARARPLRRRLGAVVGLMMVGALTSACGTDAAKSAPTWVPQQSPSPIALPGQVPDGAGDGGGGGGSSGGPGQPSPAQPSPTSPSPAPSSPTQSSPAQPSPGSPSAPSTAPSTPSSAPSTTPAPADPNVVATRLTAPTGLVVLPDGTALVGERTTGRILQVQPTAGKAVKLVRTLTGLDTSGDGGLLDLALSATYGQDGLILALITTRTDVRVVHFTLTGVVTPVLTGIPRAKTGNSGRLLVRADGSIYIGTGNAGSPALAADPKSLAGKVLHVDDVGQPAPGNPTRGSRVLTSGHTRVDGLCAGASGATYEAEADGTGAAPNDEVNLIVPGGRYGTGGTAAIIRPSVVKGISDCAVVGNVLYVTGLGGRDVFSAPLLTPVKVGPFTGQFHGKYGRLKTVVAGPDGTLWLTTSNRDGAGTPVHLDERVLHIRPSAGGGSNPA